MADGMTLAGRADPAAPTARRIRNATAVPVALLLQGESPRLEGQNRAHVIRLAEVDTPLPPILVDRRSMRVIDGMHRLTAARLNGAETIEVEFFDGTDADAFLRAVEANVTHGLPLSQADRRAAAERIIVSHPHLSDRAIAQVAGIGAKAVAAIRDRSGKGPAQAAARLGKDGKVRPLSSAEGRTRAAALLTERPQASLREVARIAGVSPATVSDVRRRLERGEAAVPARSGPLLGQPDPCGGGEPKAQCRNRQMDNSAQQQPAAEVLEKLLRDPSLRHNEDGRQLLLLLRSNAMGLQEWADLIAVVPPEYANLVGQLAKEYEQAWLGFAKELNGRSQG
jgi:transposase-like protein